MNKGSNQLETLWDSLLSRKPNLIRATFALLSKEDQQRVLQHLNKMVNEEGWQPEQRLSAQSAVEALVAQPDQDQ